MSTGSLKTGILEVIEEEAARRQRIERAAPELLRALNKTNNISPKDYVAWSEWRQDWALPAIRKAEQG